MMKTWSWAIFIFCWAGAGAAEPPAFPQDVQDYIEERMDCNRLAGEDYSDPTRGRRMAQPLRRCGMGNLQGVPASTSTVVTIDHVERRLRKKYRKQPPVLRAIDAARDQRP